MRQLTLVTAIVLISAFGLVANGAAADLWLHVRVDESEGVRVAVNLPVSMAEKVLGMLPEEHLRHARIDGDGCCREISAAKLRELWQEIRTVPDMTFVTVEEDDQKVRVWKEVGYLRVEVREEEKGETVDVRMPVRVVDALLATEGDELDLEAAIRALVDEGEGELVTVSGNGERVRVWVDRFAEAE